MVRLHILSDLHLDFGEWWDWSTTPKEADICILAGDISLLPWIVTIKLIDSIYG